MAAAFAERHLEVDLRRYSAVARSQKLAGTGFFLRYSAESADVMWATAAKAASFCAALRAARAVRAELALALAAGRLAARFFFPLISRRAVVAIRFNYSIRPTQIQGSGKGTRRLRQSVAPITRPSCGVSDRNNQTFRCPDFVYDRVWVVIQQAPPDIAGCLEMDAGRPAGKALDDRERIDCLAQESLAEPGALVLVPLRSGHDFGIGLWEQSQFHLLTGFRSDARARSTASRHSTGVVSPRS